VINLLFISDLSVIDSESGKLVRGRRMWQGGIMVTWMKTATVLLSGTIAAGMYGSAVLAADVDMKSDLPAVSGINGKLEGSIGWADMNNLSSDAEFRGGAAISIPVGDMFGLQADLSVVDVFHGTAVNGTLHAFTRDPNSYLLGVIGGYGDVGSTHVWYGGPEVELYLNNISIEAVGGLMNIDFNPTHKDKAFAIADVGFYATENFRLTAGLSSIAGFNSGHIGAEWLLADMGLPASFTVDGRIGEHGFATLSAGFSLYFGGDTGKSLIRRHREDDPPIRGLDIFGAAGDAFEGPDAPPAPVCFDNEDNPVECEA
jgi:hypothetical protein